MTTDEFAKTANALLAEGIELLRAHAGEGDVINRYVATAEKVRAQYRAAKEAPAAAPVVDWSKFVPTEPPAERESGSGWKIASGAVFASWDWTTKSGCVCVFDGQGQTPTVLATGGSEGGSFDSDRWSIIRYANGRWSDGYGPDGPAPAPAPGIYTGPVLAGMRFEYKGSVFVPDGRRGKQGEFLNAQGDGLSEPNLRGMYRPIPASAPEPSAPPAGVPVCPYRFEWCNATPCDNRRCAELHDHRCSGCQAGRPLNPPPSDPVTVATGGDECPGCDDHCEDERCPAAHGPCVDEPVATGGVPAGYQLGDGWSVGVNDWGCTNDDCAESAVYEINCGDDERDGVAACAAHAVLMGALVPIDTARSSAFDKALASSTAALGVMGTGRLRDQPLVHEGPRSYPAAPLDTARSVPPGPAHPATGTTCTRCGQVIQSVLPAFPPVETVDGWRHKRCPEVPPGPVPVEVDRQGNPRVYPCADCGTMRSLPEGGTTFTVCDECWDKRYPKASASPPAAPASEPAPTCSVPCLSRTCPRICELDHGHPPDRDHSHASRPNEAGHTWPASEPAVRPSLWERMSKHRPGAPPPSVFKGFCDEAWALEVEKVPRLEGELADEKAAHDMTRDAVKVAVDCENAARAEVEQLRGKLAEWKTLWEQEAADHRASRDQATARVSSMREAAAKVLEGGGWICGYECGHDKCVETRRLARAIRALPLDTGTAGDVPLADYGPGRCEVCGWTLQGTTEKGCVQGNCSFRPDDPSEQRKLSERRRMLVDQKTGTATDTDGEAVAGDTREGWRKRYVDLAAAQADAIKAAPHVCKCSNGPCPKCGGTGPEGEWFEGSEVECADCGAPLIVATAEPCHGSSTFEAIDEEPDEEDDESGEDAPGAVGK